MGIITVSIFEYANNRVQNLWRGNDSEESLASLHRRHLDDRLASLHRIRIFILDPCNNPHTNGMLPDNLGDHGAWALV